MTPFALHRAFKSILIIWIGSLPRAIASGTTIQKILEQSRRENADQNSEWNRTEDSRSVWELKANELLAASDSIFGTNPTASEVIGNFAAGRNGIQFNIAEQVEDQRGPPGSYRAHFGNLGEHTMIALFENYRRSKRWSDAIVKITALTKSRRIDSLPEEVRAIVAEAYENLGNRKAQLRILESIAIGFPVSPASIVSFTKINELRCLMGQRGLFLSEAFLQRIARQDIPDSGMKQFILAALQEPIERRSGNVEIISGVELLGFYSRAGYLIEAKALGESMIKEPGHDLKQESKLLLSLSKVYEDSGEIGKSIATLHSYLEKFPTSAERPNIILQMGELLMKQQNFRGAATMFQSIKHRKVSRPTSWMEFLARYQAGDFERAELILRDTPTLEPLDPQNPGAREYWLARTWENLGRKTEAVSQYLGIARSFSLSYYAFMSLVRLQSLSTELDGSDLLDGNATASLPHGSTLHDAELVFAAQLDTDEKFSNIEMNQPRGTRTFKIAKAVGKIESSQDVETFSSNFPRPYWDRVRHVSDRIGIDPLVMYSIMRAESRFRPGALSLVGAVGLLQIMPYTGSKIARLIGDEFYRAEELSVPDLNISYGAFYFNFLRESLESLPLAIAAYNAGPKAVLKWVREQKSKDLDVFIERIPFRETRKYVKEVLANLFGYERIYRGKVSLSELQNMPSSLPELDHLF